uniref:C-type lectin domain-containing protein n=1 Tax=Kryptolebias marmoratus TaxID=37003 RepID=A0A3Q3ALL9_KRYMA
MAVFKKILKPPPTPSPGDGHCLKFWVPYGRYCYYVFNEKQGYSWPDARHFCQSFWSDLVSIHSRAELEFIRNMNYTKNHNIWIGLTRDRNFGWGWMDKTPVAFLNWAAGEPNSAFHPGEVSKTKSALVQETKQLENITIIPKQPHTKRVTAEQQNHDAN